MLSHFETCSFFRSSVVDGVTEGSETPGEGLRGLAALLAHERGHHREAGQGEELDSCLKTRLPF